MNKVKIITDSTSDLSEALLMENNISIVPLYVNFGSESFKDGVNITPDELYNEVKKRNSLPKTAAPSPSDFIEAFKPHIDSGHDIIYIGLSTGFSSTIQNAFTAAAEFPYGRIEVVDSKNLSTGIGLLVMKAVDYVNCGYDVHAVAGKIRELVPKVKTAFIIDTLEYLYKGGRCSALQNLFGSMLRIRPVVQVVNGKMILAQKLMGKRSRVINTMLGNVLKQKEYISTERVFVTHSKSKLDADYLKRELENNLSVKDILITDAGCVVSSHCGPNTVGILYISKD